MNLNAGNGILSVGGTISKDLESIGEKVYKGERITDEEGLMLFEKASLPFLGSLANFVREKLPILRLVWQKLILLWRRKFALYLWPFCNRDSD